MKKYLPSFLLLAFMLTAGGCATKKAIVDNPAASTNTGQHAVDEKKLSVGSKQTAANELAFVKLVQANKVSADNIVADLMFNLKTDKKNISVPGSLHMRRGAVIRIQLFVPILRSEVGRLEFTPDYVLVVDRLHKEYIQADYNQLDFLRDNGIDFNALQSLFWNELFVPGTGKNVESALAQLTQEAEHNGRRPLSLKKGNLTYTWTADTKTAKIVQTQASYASASHGTSSLNWQYDQFKAVGGKLFPAWQSFQFTTNATKNKKQATITLDMEDITTDSKWEARTTVSSKYKKVESDDILSKLTNL